MTRILIINSAESGVHEFTKPLEKIVKETDFDAQTVEYAKIENVNLERFDGVLISGSPQGDDIVDHHKPYFEWLKDFDKPVFGICAGHHITGALFGSELLRSKEPESGDFNVEVLKDDPLFRSIPKVFKVRQMHNDSVTLPENFELLATSDTCRNQLMKHKNKPLYTSQFHPEFFNADLLRNFLRLCG